MKFVISHRSVSIDLLLVKLVSKFLVRLLSTKLSWSVRSLFFGFVSVMSVFADIYMAKQVSLFSDVQSLESIKIFLLKCAIYRSCLPLKSSYGKWHGVSLIF